MDIKYRLESINEIEYRFNYDFNYDSLNPEMINIQMGHDMKPLMEEDRIVVSAKVVEHVLDKKITVYKYKAKKNERKKQGHRQPYTKVEITGIKILLLEGRQ